MNSIFDIETVKIFILLSGSCIMFSVHAKKNMIFANKEEIFIGFQSISYNSIDTYVKKKIKGMDINEIKLYLHTGNEITFRIDGKEINEILP